MPTIFFHCPELTDNQKKEAIRKFTEVGSEVTGIDSKSFVVYLEEKNPADVGVGGEMLRDRIPKK